MKTYKHIFEELLKEENITQCFHDAAKRKTTRPEVARVLKEEREVGNDRPEPQCLQEHVKALQKMLEEETYTVMEHEATMKPTEFDREWIEDEQWKDTEFLSGLPLGFVTSQWFTQLNYKELDHKIVEEWKELGGVDHSIRYADDIVAFGRNKKKLHRLKDVMSEYMKNEMHQKIKYNWQVFRFEYPDRKAPPVIDKKTGKEKPKTRGRALDFMGFVFHYNRTTLRKSILKRATKKAHRIAKKEKVNWYDASAMLASMGWFTHTDTYGFYEDHIKPYVNIKQLKKKVSKHSKKGVKNNDVRMVSVRKYGQADRVGHDIKPDSGLSAKEHRRADQEGH